MNYISVFKKDLGNSLVVQWLKICLPVQGTWVWSLVRELRAHTLCSNKAFMPQPEKSTHNATKTQCSQNLKSWIKKSWATKKIFQVSKPTPSSSHPTPPLSIHTSPPSVQADVLLLRVFPSVPYSLYSLLQIPSALHDSFQTVILKGLGHRWIIENGIPIIGTSALGGFFDHSRPHRSPSTWILWHSPSVLLTYWTFMSGFFVYSAKLWESLDNTIP